MKFTQINRVEYVFLSFAGLSFVGLVAGVGLLSHRIEWPSPDIVGLGLSM
ncbi:hypothetical protein QA635_35065 [Bradyrhizobium brasilense]|nr:hypothetical protein [Bradyrhizobium australafricanum]WFU31668.1 hypothetical protein QA635_35065 [Bradyrhizobium australafricanum]